MSAVDVETPLEPAFSEEVAQNTLSKHFDNAELIPRLLEFCSNEMPMSEHQLLLDNTDLVTPEAVNAIRQVALRANAVSALETAYFFHRKAEVLNACLVQGVNEFFTSLNDPGKAMEFFDQVGPPPGYEEDYWDQLVDSYKEGDHVQHQVRRQVYQAPQTMGTFELDFQTSETDVSIMADVKSLLPQKYTGDQPSLVIDGENDSIRIVALQSQIQERQLLIQEFVSTGLPLLLNWMISLTPSARFGVLEQCLADVILTSALDQVLSSRQRRHLLPELSDIPMLVGDGVDPLKQLLVRVSAGQENNWIMIPDIEEQHATFMNRLALASETDRPIILRELDHWARERAQEYWFNVPALIGLEFGVESAFWAFAPLNELPPGSPRLNLQFDTFAAPFHLYRTRGLQLFALSLIEKCLKTCLPAVPPNQNKKRKRHM